MAYELLKYTLSEAWSRSRELYKDLSFLGYAGESGASYGEVAQNIREIQSYLVSQGVLRGDKVALISESRPEWGQVYLAINTMGAVAVPIMADFSAQQMCNILEHSDSVYVLASDKVISRLLDAPLVKSNKLVLIQDGLKTGTLKTEGEVWRFEEESDLLIPHRRHRRIICICLKKTILLPSSTHQERPGIPRGSC